MFLRLLFICVDKVRFTSVSMYLIGIVPIYCLSVQFNPLAEIVNCYLFVFIVRITIQYSPAQVSSHIFHTNNKLTYYG